MSELLSNKHVTVRDLAASMSISEATVRRMLKALADSNQITLVHGGATLAANSAFSFQAKLLRNMDAKRVIGQLAADLVADGDQLFLDSGTTCFEMAAPLCHKRGVSVLVNSARLALELQAPGLSVIMLGGQYRPDRMDTIGPITTSTLDQLRGYRAFIGADGLSMDFGPSAADIDSAHLYRLAVTNARETVLLVDHSKFENASLFKIVEWDKIHHVVTDAAPAPHWQTFFTERNIKVTHPGERFSQDAPSDSSTDSSSDSPPTAASASIDRSAQE